MFTFQFVTDKIDQNVKWQMALFGITVDFIIQKLKSKCIVCLIFSGENFSDGLILIGFILQKLRALVSLPCARSNEV